MKQNLPSHWEVRALEDVCNASPQNGAFIKSPKWGKGAKFVNVRDTYRDIEVNLEKVERLECDDQTIETYSLKANDLLFVRSSLKREGIGQCCVVGDLREPAIFDCHLIRVSPDQAKANSLFLTYFFTSEEGKRDLIARSKTTTMTTISQKTLMETLFVSPPLPEQKEIAHTLQTIQQAKEARQRELQLEKERKAALMQHLFTYGTRGEPEKWQKTKLGSVGSIASGGTRACHQLSRMTLAAK